MAFSANSKARYLHVNYSFVSLSMIDMARASDYSLKIQSAGQLNCGGAVGGGMAFPPVI